MKFREMLEIVGDEPVFDTGMLLVGPVDPNKVRQQLSRWTRTGHVHQLRRGLYVLGQPWQKVRPHPFLIANRLSPGSYVSGLSALAYVHAIPEFVAEITSCGGGRPQTYQNTLGRFTFRHLKPRLRFGYRQVQIDTKQSVFMAEPEKALLDLVYLASGGTDVAYLKELRLDLEALRLERLDFFVEKSGSVKLSRAVKSIERMTRETPTYSAL